MVRIMGKRRLLFIHTDLRLSGTTERLRCGVRALVAAGHEVHVLAGGGARSREVEQAGAILHTEPGLGRAWERPFVRGRARHLFKRVQADLAWVVGEGLAGVGAGLHRPYVLELDRPPTRPLPFARNHLQAVVAPCPTLVEAIVNRAGLPRQGLVILPHAPASPANPRPPFSGQGRLRVGVAGALERGLGAEILLEAARVLLDRGRDLELVLLGEGPAEADLRRRARELGIRDRVTLSAPAAPSTAELLQELDIFACPQPIGTPGWLTAQALALGRPTLLAANQGSFQWIRDGVDGLLVDPSDPGALLDGLQRLLADPEAARAMGERARMRAAGAPGTNLPSFGESLLAVITEACPSEEAGSAR